MSIIDKYDGVIAAVAFLSAVFMMLGTGLGVLGVGIWLLKKGLSFGKEKR